MYVTHPLVTTSQALGWLLLLHKQTHTQKQVLSNYDRLAMDRGALCGSCSALMGKGALTE